MAATKVGSEKRFVERVAAENALVTDLEMALPAFDDRRCAPRIDLVALERCDDHIQIVFWEEKLVEYSRLVARERLEVQPSSKTTSDICLTDSAANRWLTHTPAPVHRR